MTQAFVTSAAARQAKHSNRMANQAEKRPPAQDGATLVDLKVPRGTARALRRAPLAAVYAKRLAAGNAPK